MFWKPFEKLNEDVRIKNCIQWLTNNVNEWILNELNYSESSIHQNSNYEILAHYFSQRTCTCTRFKCPCVTEIISDYPYKGRS